MYHSKHPASSKTGTFPRIDNGAVELLSVNNGASSMQVAKGGFSPFEQYTQRGSSGPWTDVYAMAATVYYTLTGKLPPVATDRVVEDTISWDEPGLKALSAQALEALQKAMVISAKTRMQSMEELEKGLYSTTVKPEPAPAPQPMQETRPEPQPASEVKPKSQPEQEAKPESQPTPEPTPQAKAEAGKKSGKKLWIAAAAVIAVVLCGALIWANAGKPADDTNTAAFAATTPTTTPTAAATAAPTTTATVAEGTSPQPMFYGLNMTDAEFEQEVMPLFDAAEFWTKETAPQNIKDFPIFPESLFELFDTLEGAESEIEIANSTLSWKTNLLELLPVGETDPYLGYFDNNREWQRAAFTSVGNGTYTVTASADALAANSLPTMHFDWYTFLEGWGETICVSYDILNQRIEQTPYVSMQMWKGDYLIEWGHNNWDGKNNFTINICIFVPETSTTSVATSICFLTYDAASGKLTEVRK